MESKAPAYRVTLLREDSRSDSFISSPRLLGWAPDLILAPMGATLVVARRAASADGRATTRVAPTKHANPFI